MNKLIKNMFSPTEIQPAPQGEGRAQQQFKNDCDVNWIMEKFQRTGVISHVNQFQPEYGFANSQTLHQAMNIVAKAESMFAELPSKIRNEFENSPSKFLDFVQNPDNAAKAKELGLELAPGVAPPQAPPELVEPQDGAITGEAVSETTKSGQGAPIE
jgi:phage internal scaffolding protein